MLINPIFNVIIFRTKSISPKLRPLERPQSADQVKLKPQPPPPKSACGHPNAGQELCYLCHQRERRNIPVSFVEERKRREEEEDKLLQQFQHMKDAEETLGEQVCLIIKLSTYIMFLNLLKSDDANFFFTSQPVYALSKNRII